MNVRIKLLAEQAARQHGHTIKFSGEITETLNSFAELIVKECINELEANKKCDPYTGELIDSDWNDITQFQIINLKGLFGVEE